MLQSRDKAGHCYSTMHTSTNLHGMPWEAICRSSNKLFVAREKKHEAGLTMALPFMLPYEENHICFLCKTKLFAVFQSHLRRCVVGVLCLHLLWLLPMGPPNAFRNLQQPKIIYPKHLASLQLAGP